MEHKELFHAISFTGNLLPSCHFNWSDENIIALPTLEGIRIFELIADGSTPFHIRRDVILPPTEIIERDYGIDKTILRKSLTKEDRSRMQLERILSPKDICNVSYKGFQSAVWSPRGVGPYHTCCLAVLTADHWLALYTRFKKLWIRISVLSDVFYDHLKSDNFAKVLEMTDRQENTTIFDTFINRTYAASTVKIIWSHLIEVGKASNRVSFGCLFAAQKNGNVVLWKVKTSLNHSNVIEITKIFNCDVGLISALHWIELNSNSGFLLVGGVNGRCNGFEITFENVDVNVRKTVLWCDEDKLQVSTICSYKAADQTFIIAGKGCYLVAWRLMNTVIEKISHTSGTYVQSITGMACIKDAIAACTADGTQFNISIDSNSNEIQVTRTFNTLEDKGQTCCGIASSPNKIMLCASKSIICSYDHLVIREPSTLLFLSCNTTEDESFKVESFIDSNNPMTFMRDVLFYLSHSYQKTQVFPPDLLQLMQSDGNELCEFSSTKLQLLRWLYCFFPFLEQNDDSSTSIYVMNSTTIETLLVHRKLLRFLKWFAEHNPDSSVTHLHKRRKLICDWFQKHFHVLTKTERETVDNCLKSWKNEDPVLEECHICHSSVSLESLQYGKCSKNHVLARCCFSLILLGQQKQRKCSKCNIFADSDLTDLFEDFTCPFCSEVMH